MTGESSARLDPIDFRILDELQRNARLSFAELARRVALSSPAVTERVRRLESLGVISGYRAQVRPDLLGAPIMAFVRLRHNGADYRAFRSAIAAHNEVIECHHITGEDCFVMKVAAESMPHLEELTRSFAVFGSTTTSVVYSTVLEGRPIAPRSRR